MPKPIEAPDPSSVEGDDNNLENGGNKDGNTVKAPPVDPAAAAVAAVKPTGNEEVDKLVRAALAEALPTALQAALTAQQQEAQRVAAENAAREQGDYKTLFEQSEKDRLRLQLNEWRGEALREAKLDIKWFDSIQGNTKEEMVAFAKQFKKNLDDEVAAQKAQLLEEHPGTPRGSGKHVRTRTDKPTGTQKTQAALNTAFGVGRLRSV